MPKKESHKSLLERAHQQEAADDLPAAIKLYEEAIQNDPLTIAAYNRLMVIYRKQKEYKKELAVINQAIKALQANEDQVRKDWLKQNRKAAKLSQALAKSLGVMDAKGKMTQEDPVVTAWKKRKAVTTKRLKAG